MKTTLRLLSIAATLTLLSCGSDEAPEATTTEAKPVQKDTIITPTVQVDTFHAQAEVSSIGWKCSKPLRIHSGLIKISKGWLGLVNGNINQGAFTIDMKSISDSDEKDSEKNKKLIDHLSDKDFFDVATFPTGEFVITSATDTTITGNLTLKGKSNSITFPYSTMIKNGSLIVAKAKFSIDRNNWGIIYNGKSIAGVKPDNIISDMIELDVTLTAERK